MNFFLFFFLFNVFLSIDIPKGITEYFSENRGAFYITLQIGEPYIDKQILLDIESDYNIIDACNNQIFYSSSKKLIYRLEVQYKEVSTMSELYSDRIRFPSSGLKIGNFHYQKLSYKPQLDVSTLSLSLGQNSRYSIVNMLYKQGCIRKKRFSFLGQFILEDYTRGKVIFGELREETKNLQNFSCDIKSNVTKWSCYVKRISFVNKEKEYSYDVNNIVVLRTTENYIRVPVRFFEVLEKKIFNEYFIRKDCLFLQFKDSSHIECKCNTIDDIVLFLHFDENKAIKLSKKFLFKQFSSQCVFQVASHLKNNEWVLGSFFLKKFITTFDYDERRVTFYTNNTEIFVDEKKERPTRSKAKYIIIVMIGLLCMMNIHLIVIKANNNL